MRPSFVARVLLAFMLTPLAAMAQSGPSLFIGMPDTFLEPGDTLGLRVTASVKDGPLEGRLAVALLAGPDTLWYPSWGPTFETEAVTLDEGSTTLPIFPNTLWPEVISNGAQGLQFVAALLDESGQQLLAGPVSVTFGYAPFEPGFSIRPDATLLMGPVPGEPGSWILCNGRKITPPGDMYPTIGGPLNVYLTPDNKHAVFTHASKYDVSLTVHDIDTGAEVSRYEENDLNFYFGLDGTADGRTIYAADGRDKVWVFDLNNGVLGLREQWDAPRCPMGLTLSEDESTLYVVTQLGDRLHAFDTATGNELSSVEIGLLPHHVILHPTLPIAYATVEGDDLLSIVDISDPANLVVRQEIPLRQNPEGLALDAAGETLYVAISNEDAIAVIDTGATQGIGNASLTSYIDLRPTGATAFHTSPNALYFGPSGNRLYITESLENKVSVIDVSGAAPQAIGTIPTAWYPVAATFTTDGRMVIVNHKGLGLSKTDTFYPGNFQVLDIPTTQELAAYAPQVVENNLKPARLFDIPDPSRVRSPIPADQGVPSEQIKHVFLVVRENKTYDIMFGDLGRGNGDPAYQEYFDGEVVNIRNLANEFVNCDNYYSNAEISVQGHTLTTQGMMNAYVDKAWASRREADVYYAGLDFIGDLGLLNAFDLEVFLNPSTFVYNENIFRHCMANDVSVRVYGEIVGTGHEGLIFDTNIVHWSLNDLPVINYAVKDVDKLADRIAEWESPGWEMPQLVYMLLPNDHGAGDSFGFPTRQSMVADTDEATGQFVEWLSKSKWWDSSVAFIIQDDPINGDDHVDQHRSINVVASPWVKRGHISSVHYCEAHIYATICRILGLPPMSGSDEKAQPMYDLFTMAPDFTPWEHTPRIYPEEMNPPATLTAHMSKSRNWNVVDEVDDDEDLQRISMYGARAPEHERFVADWFTVFKTLYESKEERMEEWDEDMEPAREAYEAVEK